MSECIGQLQQDDPMYGCLIEDALHLGRADAVFDVYPLDEFKTIFRYELRDSETSVVGKFYGHKWLYGRQDGFGELRAKLMHGEFENLRRVQALGLDNDSYRAVRPLAVNESLDCVLIEEFAPGVGLESTIPKAAHHGDGEDLCHYLELIASFLADLHNRSEMPETVKRDDTIEFLADFVAHLVQWDIVRPPERSQLESLCHRWDHCELLGTVPQVLAHGDTTPQHFRFDSQRGLTVIDWESLQPNDRASDIGLLAGELKHAFYCQTGDIWASEPYIQHLYQNYFDRATGNCGSFTDFTTRGRFYMGCNLLRMCRNPWMNLDYRRSLIPEALGCLNI